MPDAYDYSTLEFVRSAEEGDDPTVRKEGGTLWRAPGGEEIWMHPSGIMQHGLTEKMRAGVMREIEGLEPALWGSGSQGPPALEPEIHQGPPKPPTILGGYTEDWRWSLVGDLLVLDNKPKVDRHRTEQAEYVESERVRIPLELVRAIVESFASA